MIKTQYNTFNLEVSRPKILVTGNGLIYENTIKWSYLLQKVSRENIDMSRYEKRRDKIGNIEFQVPNNILTLATSVIDDKERHKVYVDALKDYNQFSNSKINRLLKMPFDAILTTNYTYEWETELNPKYQKYSSATKRKFTETTGVADAKYLLHTFNHITSESPEIWHIHGELRRPSSMILSHDEYARYIHKILSHNKARGYEYTKYFNNLKMKSWIDYFLLGDVYILGLSMDYSEFDLWWLLGRRMREKTGFGKVIFYEPASKDKSFKQFALNDVGVTVENCGVNMDNGGDYENFYQLAINDIELRINNEM